MKTPRPQVYEAIEHERNYQDAKWNPRTTASGGVHSTTEWLVYLDDYIREAKFLVTRNADPEANVMALHVIRKVAAMAVACMEQNGCHTRDEETRSKPIKRPSWAVEE
jgi:hypothetical protein